MLNPDRVTIRPTRSFLAIFSLLCHSNLLVFSLFIIMVAVAVQFLLVLLVGVLIQVGKAFFFLSSHDIGVMLVPNARLSLVIIFLISFKVELFLKNGLWNDEEVMRRSYGFNSEDSELFGYIFTTNVDFTNQRRECEVSGRR